jgi:hypothetical protein
LLAAGFLALFLSGLLSAPFTFIFATPAYIMSGARCRRRFRLAPNGVALAALAACPAFFFASGLLITTRHRRDSRSHARHSDARAACIGSRRTPYFGPPLCRDPRLMLCLNDPAAGHDPAPGR